MYKRQKIAFITERLDLSQKEAQKFWPIYNAFENENMNLKRQSFEGRKNIDFTNLKDEDALYLLNDMRAVENKKTTLKNKFIDDLLKIISAKKIILLVKAEDDFKRKIFEEFKHRREMNRSQNK